MSREMKPHGDAFPRSILAPASGPYLAAEVVTLGDVLRGGRAARLSATETVIIDLTGAGAQDAAIAAAAWERVLRSDAVGEGRRREEPRRARL